MSFVEALEVHKELVQVGRLVSGPFVSLAEATEVEDLTFVLVDMSVSEDS